MLWLGFALLAAVALAFVLWPLLRAQSKDMTRRSHDLAVYRAQLAEVTQDQDRGVLSENEAAAARLEIQRRLLRADEADANLSEARGGGVSPAVRAISLIAIVLVPLLGGGLYLANGRPEAAGFDRAFAQAQAENEARLRAETEQLIARLQQRLETEPQRVDGWLLLGHSLLAVNRSAEAVEAITRVIELDPDNAEAHALRGEAQTQAADGSVTPAAQRDFHLALSLDPQHPGARYYLGLARLQEGDIRGAYDDWYGLAAGAPSDAGWLDLVQRRLRELAPRLGIALSEAVPPSRPAVAGGAGPSRDQMEAAQQMSDAERTEMIRGMVDRLAQRLEENPDDVDGWLRLARAREVLGETDAVREALRRAVALQPGRIEARVALAFSLAGPTVKSRDPLPPDAVAEFREVLAIDPQHAQALWFVGRGAYEEGDKAAAGGHWKNLLALLPPDSPEARELSQRIEGLGL